MEEDTLDILESKEPESELADAKPVEPPEPEFDGEPDAKLQDLLSAEKKRADSLEEKLKHTLADFQNLERKTATIIETGVRQNTDKFLVDFIQIYDDFVLAKNVAPDNKAVTDGFISILKNMDALLSKYGVTPIESLGKIFDPNLHEAISITEDDSLDENTITKEIRKGYISHQKAIRPALVEISKKSKSE